MSSPLSCWAPRIAHVQFLTNQMKTVHDDWQKNDQSTTPLPKHDHDWIGTTIIQKRNVTLVNLPCSIQGFRLACFRKSHAPWLCASLPEQNISHASFRWSYWMWPLFSLQCENSSSWTRSNTNIHSNLHSTRGYYGCVAPRSGLAKKHGIDVGAGVLDSHYRGEIKVILFNRSDEHYTAT